MVLASLLLGALPKAHAFVGSGRLFVARLSVPPSASRLATAATATLASARQPLALGRYHRRVRAAPARTDFAAASALKSLTGSSALFASGGAATVGVAGRGATAAGVTMDGGAAGKALTKHVLVPVADGSEEIESVTIIDTLVRAGAVVTVASVTDGVEVNSEYSR